MSFSDSVNDCDSESSNDLVDRSWEENIYRIKDKLVNGPEGNKILIDSPTPSELPPPYSDSDHPLTTTNIRDQSRELREPSSSSNSNGGINRQPKPRRVIGNYTLSSTIGAGSMGKVRLAIHNTTKEKVYIYIYIYAYMLNIQNNTFNIACCQDYSQSNTSKRQDEG